MGLDMEVVLGVGKVVDMVATPRENVFSVIQSTLVKWVGLFLIINAIKYN